jgi:hypothetical protein
MGNVGSQSDKLRQRIVLTSCFVLVAIAMSFAQEHGRYPHELGQGPARIEGGEEGLAGLTGQISGWLFGIANLPVALSIILKSCGKLKQINSTFNEAAGRLNRRQKYYLMNFHYWLNPVALGVAFIHFLAAKCESTAMPEVGLGAMLLVCVLGIAVTFKWSPEPMRKAVFRLHTSSITLFAILAILVAGHSMVH